MCLFYIAIIKKQKWNHYKVVRLPQSFFSKTVDHGKFKLVRVIKAIGSHLYNFLGNRKYFYEKIRELIKLLENNFFIHIYEGPTTIVEQVH